MDTGDREGAGNAIKAGAGPVSFRDVVESESEAERERLIAGLVSRMSLDEKIKQMSGSSSLIDLGVMMVRYGAKTFDAGPNSRLGIWPLRFTDGPRGICLDSSTCFPVSMARGATWDAELQERVGSAMGTEARAQGANFYGGVCINVPRHPGWGRAQETFGEDPCHLGVLGVAMVDGVQKHVMACAKHYACNSIEESRFFVDVRLDERTLREIYLPHFKKCVDAGVASIMSAYNRVNGQFCGHNAHLLRDILKEGWGFDGFVMSDFVFGVRSGKDGVNGGLDMEMPKRWRFGWRLKRAVRSGKVPVSSIDEAVVRILRQKARFAGVGDPGGYEREKVACREHADLAMEVARKGMVLLKNDSSALPLDRKEIKRIAVIGALADRANIGDMGSSRVYPPYVVTPLAGIRDRAGDSVQVVYSNGKKIDEARRVAGAADAAIVVVGLTSRDEGEYMSKFQGGGDREDLDLPAEQERLILAASEESERCIVIIEAGSAVTMEAWKDTVAAIVMAWYPGMEGGNAIADILFGEVNPGGKLPVTFPKSTDQLPHFDRKARAIDYGYYHGYRLFDKEGLEPAFPFGFGMSYTRYEYGNLRLSNAQTGKSGSIEVHVDVTNVGDMAGDEIAQLYIGYGGSRVDRPVRELKGFTRLSLAPGETKTGTFTVEAQDLAFYDTERAAWEIEEIEYVAFVGASSKQGDLKLSGTFKVSGP